ncbi:hypothetical protein AMAG_14056 [Allomyces macrogynus ATCC 38327]|uniref:Cytochrome P450 n=1 Tax=Allomyces macrogynus (strain ATCC 38327) TaxID=578462 RepID=A0A0L0T3W6_ALLM3|nr:hypothetical protein AMAG_14056 [Allomyces macrogynus ATCC 38327]|eukprot:KNE69488.1 hypothetical protein AMAG_14056 [Allomyces macrogynus ATCC 38327]
MLHTLLTALVKADLAEWTTKGKTHVLVYWKSIGEWADVLVAWAKDNGFANTVVTGYEVRLGDYVTDQEFYAMDEAVFAKVVAHLDHQRRIVMVNPSSNVDELGFKIIGSQLLLSRRGVRLSGEDLHANTIIFFLAGHDTTAYELCLAIYLMGLHKDVQNKARAEETMRLFPRVAKLPRRITTAPVTLTDGTKLQAGTKITVDTYAMQQDNAVYDPDADEFKPDRWASTNDWDESGRAQSPWWAVLLYVNAVFPIAVVAMTAYSVHVTLAHRRAVGGRVATPWERVGRGYDGYGTTRFIVLAVAVSIGDT